MRVACGPSFAVCVVDEVPVRLEVSGSLGARTADLLAGLLDAVRDGDERVLLDLSALLTVDEAGQRCLDELRHRLAGALEVTDLPTAEV